MNEDEEPCQVSPQMLFKLSKKIAQLTKVIYSLNTKNEDLESEIENIKMDSQNKYKESSHDQINKMDSSEKERMMASEELKKELKRAKHAMKSMENKMAIKEKEIKYHFDKMRQESEQIQLENKIISNTKNKIKSLENQVKILAKERSELISKVNSAEVNNETLKEDLEALKNENKKVNKANAGLALELSAARIQIRYEAVTTEEKSSSSEDFQNLECQTHQLTQELNDVKNDYETLKKKFFSSGEKISFLEKSLRDERETHEREIENSRIGFESEVFRMKSELASFQLELAEMTRKYNEVKESKISSFVISEEMNRHQSDEITSSRIKINELEKALESALEERQDILEAADKEITFEKNKAYSNKQKLNEDFEWKLREIEAHYSQAYKALEDSKSSEIKEKEKELSRIRNEHQNHINNNCQVLETQLLNVKEENSVKMKEYETRICEMKNTIQNISESLTSKEKRVRELETDLEIAKNIRGNIIFKLKEEVESEFTEKMEALRKLYMAEAEHQAYQFEEQKLRVKEMTIELGKKDAVFEKEKAGFRLKEKEFEIINRNLTNRLWEANEKFSKLQREMESYEWYESDEEERKEKGNDGDEETSSSRNNFDLLSSKQQGHKDTKDSLSFNVDDAFLNVKSTSTSYSLLDNEDDLTNSGEPSPSGWSPVVTPGSKQKKSLGKKSHCAQQ